MLYVNKSYTKQATAVPRTNDPFLTEQERRFLERNKNDTLWKETRTNLLEIHNGKLESGSP